MERFTERKSTKNEVGSGGQEGSTGERREDIELGRIRGGEGKYGGGEERQEKEGGESGKDRMVGKKEKEWNGKRKEVGGRKGSKGIRREERGGKSKYKKDRKGEGIEGGEDEQERRRRRSPPRRRKARGEEWKEVEVGGGRRKRYRRRVRDRGMAEGGERGWREDSREKERQERMRKRKDQAESKEERIFSRVGGKEWSGGRITFHKAGEEKEEDKRKRRNRIVRKWEGGLGRIGKKEDRSGLGVEGWYEGRCGARKQRSRRREDGVRIGPCRSKEWHRGLRLGEEVGDRGRKEASGEGGNVGVGVEEDRLRRELGGGGGPTGMERIVKERRGRKMERKAGPLHPMEEGREGWERGGNGVEGRRGEGIEAGGKKDRGRLGIDVEVRGY
ncbi:hypothetical protein Tco_1202690 [Tanacetum coccineum]